MTQYQATPRVSEGQNWTGDRYHLIFEGHGSLREILIGTQILFFIEFPELEEARFSDGATQTLSSKQKEHLFYREH